MFFIVAVSGCLPYVDILLDESGDALSFETREKAEEYAKENCAWEWRIVEF